EMVPLLLRPHPRADLLARLDQALGGKHLDRLAHGGAAGAELLDQIGFPRHQVARPIAAPDDRLPDGLDDPAVDAAHAVFRPARHLFRFRLPGHSMISFLGATARGYLHDNSAI